MKQFFTIFITAAAAFSTANAQTASSAQTILSKMAAKVQAAKGINVSFSLTQKNKAGQAVHTAKGVLKVKGDKYYLRQGETEVFCNGQKVWNYDGDKEVTIASVDESDEDAFSPRQVLTGFNAKDYTAQLISSAGSANQVQLVPVDKRKNFKEIVLHINKTTNLVTKAVITDKLNAATEVAFSDINLNASLPDSQFVFDAAKHPGVEIVNQ